MDRRVAQFVAPSGGGGKERVRPNSLSDVSLAGPMLPLVVWGAGARFLWEVGKAKLKIIKNH